MMHHWPVAAFREYYLHERILFLTLFHLIILFDRIFFFVGNQNNLKTWIEEESGTRTRTKRNSKAETELM